MEGAEGGRSSGTGGGSPAVAANIPAKGLAAEWGPMTDISSGRWGWSRGRGDRQYEHWEKDWRGRLGRDPMDRILGSLMVMDEDKMGII